MEIETVQLMHYTFLSLCCQPLVLFFVEGVKLPGFAIGSDKVFAWFGNMFILRTWLSFTWYVSDKHTFADLRK